MLPRHLLVVLLTLIALVATGCGTRDSAVAGSSASAVTGAPALADVVADAQQGTPTSDPVELLPPEVTQEKPSATPEADSAAFAPLPGATKLPPAPIGFDALSPVGPGGPLPVSIKIEAINVAGAEIVAVGVNEDLTFEVPPAEQVGWYEFGPRPGEQGSSVLAAHIAYDGIDGVFRFLSDVEIGSIVELGFDDGTTERYRIEEVTEYLKEELPDSLFDRSGSPQLALITCGGSFNPQLSSYESNTVVIAVPI